MIFKRSHNPRISFRLKKAGARLFFVFLVLLLTTANSLLYAESIDQNIRISFDENVLSIWVKDADLKEVLFKLADETNINVRVPLSFEKKISINRSEISLSEGLEGILKNLNHIILYSGTKNHKPLISKVLVFSKSEKSRTLAGGEMHSADSEVESARREIKSANKIIAYERQIESFKNKLSKIDENSTKGKYYSKRINRLKKLIEMRESQLN